MKIRREFKIMCVMLKKLNKSELANQRPAVSCLLQIVQERKLKFRKNVILCKIIELVFYLS